MKTALFAAAVSLAVGGPAFAAERAPALHAPAPACAPIDKIKADFDAKTHFVALTPGQFHFAAGIYVGNPSTPEGMPPGDGALLITHDGSKSGTLVWTRGRNGCSPMTLPEPMLKLLAAIKTGADETLGDDTSEDLSL